MLSINLRLPSRTLGVSQTDVFIFTSSLNPITWKHVRREGHVPSELVFVII